MTCQQAFRTASQLANLVALLLQFITQHLFHSLFHPCMYIQVCFQKSPAPCSFCCLFGFWVFFCFVWPLFAKETFPNTAQADLCISCMNGGSTRAKKTPGSVRSRYCDQSLQDVVRPYIARRTNQTSPSRARPNRLYMLWISWPSIFHLPPGGIEEGTRMSVAAIAHDFSAAVRTKALTWQPSAPPAQG